MVVVTSLEPDAGVEPSLDPRLISSMEGAGVTMFTGNPLDAVTVGEDAIVVEVTGMIGGADVRSLD